MTDPMTAPTPLPALVWREDANLLEGQSLWLGDRWMGSFVREMENPEEWRRDDAWHGYVVNRHGTASSLYSFPTRRAAQDAVEAAVRKALT